LTFYKGTQEQLVLCCILSRWNWWGVW